MTTDRKNAPKKQNTLPAPTTALKRAYEAAAYDKWFRAQVQEALDDPRPSIPHDEVMADWRNEKNRLLPPK